MMFSSKEVEWEVVMVRDIPMLFTPCRVKPSTVPDGLYMYGVRHADDDWGEPVQIAEWVVVNHFGTLLSLTALPLERSPVINNAYMDISADSDWGYVGVQSTIAEFMSEEVQYDIS